MDEHKPPQNGRLRRSARQKADFIPVDASAELDASISAAPRKKRALTKSKGKGKTGKLQGIMVMPLDVLFEILSYLRPLDILHLSRTTKEFRRVLMNKTNMFVWKAARTNVPDYPECFPDMNEAQMARLAFDSHCFVCLRPNCRTPDWVLRVRLCRKCTSTSLINIHTNAADETAALACITYNSHSRGLAFTEEIESIKTHWESLKGAEKLAYVGQRKKFKLAVNLHAIDCAAWSELQRILRLQELQDVRNDRKASIIEKLSELGWGPEIEQIPKGALDDDPLAQHKLVKQPTALTNRIWTNIKPEMIMFMERMKQHRLDRERQAVITSRKRPAIEAISAYKASLLPWTEVMPEPPDYCQMAAVKAILELPSDVDIDASSFAAVIPGLSSLFAEWRQDLHMQMLRLLEKEDADDFEPDSPSECLSESPSPETVIKLQLATTVFCCKTCRAGNNPISCTFSPSDLYAKFQPLFYPDVLNHPCLTRELYPGRTRPDDSVDLEQQRNRARAGWTCGQLEKLWIDARAVEMMKAVIRFCKLDPASATVAELDELDVWMACPCCVSWNALDEADVPVFGWRNAYKHQVEEHDSRPINWMELSEKQKAQALTADALLYTSTTTAERWSCVHCMDRTCESTPYIIADVKRHLLDQHAVTQPEVYIDYYTLGANKAFAHRSSRATFDISESEDLRRSKLVAMEIFARLFRKYVFADATELDVEEGYMEFLRQTADGYVDSDSEDGHSD
ncbi:hypothetical protein FIBSPDRAFT_1047991 [Athelia psychrophila]|uniref:F-box domain-containing protein n=1 Tax=Athelia psychrophila TaxID=1759441 RepID=A0A166ED08_9AGAM|nr:hypothetical protein FIBSPDRAFT_1047991 [Fibularhizoctonia sp. CBS 109695]